MKNLFLSWLRKPRSRTMRNLVYAFIGGVCGALVFAIAWKMYWMFPVSLFYIRDGSLDGMRYMYPNVLFPILFELNFYFALAGFVVGFLYSLFMDTVWIPTFERKTSS